LTSAELGDVEEPLPLEISEDIRPEEKKRHVARTKTTKVNIICILVHILRRFRIRILGSVHWIIDTSGI
jgi:hypothetical protein